MTLLNPAFFDTRFQSADAMAQHRLLFYTHALVGGGAERVWALVASGLSARGHDVAFAVDYDAPHNEHLIAAPVRRHLLGRGHVAATRSLARILSRDQPEVAFAAAGASNLKLLTAKSVSSWRGAAVLSVHGRYKAEGRFLGRAAYAATALTSRLSARTIAVSDDLRHYLIDRLRADPRRVVRIHNGVLLPPIDQLPSPAALSARADVVLAVGRLVPEKGMVNLVDAMAMLKRKAQLIILGEGPERAHIERAIGRNALGGRVELRGYVNEPWPVFGEAKLLALTSRTEAFGNVLVEALGHGLPVVATRCGGPEEILDEGRYGRLVPVGEPAALAEAIDEALEQPGDPLRHRARAEQFSLDRALDQFEELIEGILSERRSRFDPVA